MRENSDDTALNALICYHGRALMLAQGWPDNKPFSVNAVL